MTTNMQNRAIVADFVDIFMKQRAIRAAFEKHVATDYIQHSAGIANGRENAIVALEAMFARLAGVTITVRHVLVDGDHAAVHIRGESADRAYEVVDLFRLENGKIVEHWDVFAPVREKMGQTVI